MKRGDLIIGALVAASVHAGVFSIGSLFSQPSVMMQRGESAVMLRLIPSTASQPIMAQDDPVDEPKRPLSEPEQKRRPPRTTTVIAFSHPQVLPPDELAIKVNATTEEQSPERSDLRPEVKNPLVRVEDPDERSPAPAKSKREHRIQKQADKISSASSKEVEGDMKEKGVTVPASITGIIKPRYPASCRRKGCQGKAIFEFTILPDGTCADIELLQSAGCEKLDEAAREALVRATFAPARRMGAPVASRKKLAFRFTLTDL